MTFKKKLGLALGGGFLRGAAHIGVLKVLVSEDIVPDMVAGTSAGSIVAALYCSGWSPKKLEEIALKMKPNQFYGFCPTILNLTGITLKAFFDFLRLPVFFSSPLGLTSGKRLEAWLRQLLERKTFNHLKTKLLAITSVDINTGMRVVFVSDDANSVSELPGDIVFIRGVDVAAAVTASCAVPGLFEPKKIGIRFLVDGGLKENVPVEVLSLLGADVIVGVDVGCDGEPYKQIDNIVQLLSQSLDIIGSVGISSKLEEFADLVIEPLLKNVTPWDFSRISYCIEQGEKATREMLPSIRSLLRSFPR